MSNPVSFVIPNNPEDKKNILKSTQEICDSFTRIQGERDFIKAEIEALSEKFEVPKKILNRFVKAYYKANIKDVASESEELVEFYEQLTGDVVNE